MAAIIIACVRVQATIQRKIQKICRWGMAVGSRILEKDVGEGSREGCRG